MNTYLIHRNGLSVSAYYQYVATLPWGLNSSGYQIDPTLQTVTVDGTITGYTLVNPSSAQQINWGIKTIAFRRRFSMPEQTAIYTLAQTDSLVKAYVEGLNAEIAAWSGFDLSDTSTVEYQGVQYLVSKNAITSTSATTILTTPPTIQLQVYPIVVHLY